MKQRESVRSKTVEKWRLNRTDRSSSVSLRNPVRRPPSAVFNIENGRTLAFTLWNDLSTPTIRHFLRWLPPAKSFTREGREKVPSEK